MEHEWRPVRAANARPVQVDQLGVEDHLRSRQFVSLGILNVSSQAFPKSFKIKEVDIIARLYLSRKGAANAFSLEVVRCVPLKSVFESRIVP